MIGYITVGTNNLAEHAKFYDALFELVGAKRTMEIENYFIAWGNSPTAPMFSLAKPFDGNSATAGNGTMIALAAKNPEQVDALYNKAIALGASDEGAPGPRGDDGFYAGYFRDLDGNKINAFCMG